MSKIYLCFLWHMHQPFYKDLVSGEYRLPWTRLHALKDYYGMVKILEEFPSIHQTFNLVPSMMVQVEEYARGEAKDPFLDLALKPAETLTAEDQATILRSFFLAHPARMIYRYPRYGELYDAYQARKSTAGARGVFGPAEYRDLQVLSQLAWFDEEFQDHDPEVRALIEKGRHFTAADQALVGRKEREICALVIPQYRRLAAAGQIEISTTPFYHPILPLICDTNIAAVSHPGVALPPRFAYPEDARLQLESARAYIEKTFGVAPAGLWPSEGSVSDEALRIAAAAGFTWTATDNGVLERTLGRVATPSVTYRPWRWEQHGARLSMVFRDHALSDLIGFVYSGMDAREAARDFLRRIEDNCAPVLAAGRDALVPIILDGENAWEYYDHSGRPFFRALYGGIQANTRMEALTMSEALQRIEPEPLDRIFPGSWIDANFDVWIGAAEDNKAWQLLLAARQAYGTAQNVPEPQRKLAREELFIAEGSDWNWWYGPEHESANRIEFDQIYREHLANVYRALGIPAPMDLSRPILSVEACETHTPPSALISPTVNGVIDSYFEWLGAGVYRVDRRTGSMHGKRALVREVHYGADDAAIYVRVDFAESPATLDGLEIHVESDNGNAVAVIDKGAAEVRSGPAQAVFRDVLEIALPKTSPAAQLTLSFWQDGLPLDAIPREGVFHIAAPSAWTA